MRKFMKYEIKGSYKFFLGVIAALLIASTVIQYNIYRTTDKFSNSLEATGFSAFMVFVSVLVIFGAFLVTFFHIVGLFKNELYENRGYLTFTLPLTGNQILGAKLLVGLIWYALMTISIVLFNFILATIFYGLDWFHVLKDVLNYSKISNITSILIPSILVSVQSSIMVLILVYLSVSLSKVSVKNRKIGGLWFVIFLILSWLVGLLSTKIANLFPYYLNVRDLSILHYYDINPLQSININFSRMFIFETSFNGYINIAGTLSELVFMVLGFLATSYLIERKIDL